MKKRQRTSTNDAIEMLESDHDKVKRLFKDYDGATGKRKPEIVKRILEALEVHTALEEKIFYPAVESRSKTEGKSMVEEALEEHAQAKELIAEIRELDPEDEEYETTLKKLQEDVEHHIQEEEDEMLPLAERVLGDEVERLGEEMKEMKAQLSGVVSEVSRY